MAFVQAARSNTTDNVTFTNPNGPGNLLVAICGEELSAGNITGCTSTGLETWNPLPQQSAGHVGRLFWAISNGTSSNKVSFAVSGSPSGFGQIGVAEYSLTTLLDSSNQGVGDITSPVPVTTTHPNCLVIGGFDTGYVGYVGDGTYTIRTDTVTGNCRVAIADATFAATGTYAPNLSDPTGMIERFTIAFYPAPTGSSISGNAGVAGATVNYSGQSSGSTTADGSGNYTITALTNGNYTVTPVKTAYIFSPPYRKVTVSGSNIANVNFTAAQTHGWSPVDCRRFATFPNFGMVQVDGSVHYVGQISSNEHIPTPTSNPNLPPTDSRISDPENSRVDPSTVAPD